MLTVVELHVRHLSLICRCEFVVTTRGWPCLQFRSGACSNCVTIGYFFTMIAVMMMMMMMMMMSDGGSNYDKPVFAIAFALASATPGLSACDVPGGNACTPPLDVVDNQAWAGTRQRSRGRRTVRAAGWVPSAEASTPSTACTPARTTTTPSASCGRWTGTSTRVRRSWTTPRWTWRTKRTPRPSSRGEEVGLRCIGGHNRVLD